MKQLEKGKGRIIWRIQNMFPFSTVSRFIQNIKVRNSAVIYKSVFCKETFVFDEN